MAKTLTQIETLVQFNARDDSIALTTDPGLSIANSIYRAVASLLPWPEFRKTVSTTATTLTTTGNYAWVTTNVFGDVRSVEVGATATDATFQLLVSPPTELDWNLASKQANTIPVYYVRHNTGGADKVELRPNPSYAGASIKVTGIVEPTDLVNGSSVTDFLTSSADDALAHLIAASFAVRDGFAPLAQVNTQRATEILQKIFGAEQVPAESIRNLTGQQ